MSNQQAAKDDNDVSSLLVVSSIDGTTMKVKGNPVTGAMLVDTSGGFVNPMTTTGDIIYSSDNSGTPARLGIGTAGQQLTVAAGIPSWSSGGTGTVTSVSVVTANGVSGSVATATTTPAITLTLGAITPTTVNGLTVSTTTGTLTIASGKTLTNNNNITLAGTDGKTLTLTTGLTVTTNDGTLAFGGASKTLTVNKTISFTAADDTGVYTLPTGTKTLVATDVATLSSLTAHGTITSGGLGTGAVIGGVTMTLGSDANYDTYYRNSSGVLTRLANGTTGQVLTATTSNAPSWAAASTGSMTLLKANDGTSTNAGAINLDTISISGLTSLDSIMIILEVDAVGADMSGHLQYYNNTDSVVLSDVLNSVSPAASSGMWGQSVITNSKVNSKFIKTRDYGTNPSGSSGSDNGGTGIVYHQSVTFTTDWTGSWTLALRSTAIQGGCTIHWRWSVYKIAGQ